MYQRTALALWAAMSLAACKPLTENNSVNAQAVDEEQFMVDSTLESLSDLDETEEIASSQLGCQTDGNNSILEINFANYLIPGTRVLVNGDVERLYSTSSCQLQNPGDLFQREHDLQFSRVYGNAVLKSLSADHQNYLGQTLGGGEILTKTNTGWQIDILGKQQTLIDSSGQKFMDISVETLSPFVIEGTLRRAQRHVVSGQVAVYHNRAQFKSILTYDDLKWNSDCRCPIEGSITATNDRRPGTASIEFLACGKAKISRLDGREREIPLPRCLL